MGYFEGLVALSKSKEELKKLEENLEKLYYERKNTYLDLLKSPAYSKELISKREAAIKQFKEFFESIGFEVRHLQNIMVKGFTGITATVNETTIKLSFKEEREFDFVVPEVYSAEFTLQDRNDEEVIVGVTESNGELDWPDSYDADDYESLLKIQNELKQDIVNIKKKIAAKYKPEIVFYNWNDGSEYEDFKIFINEINEVLQ
ncbi:hypothetical protein [Planococcus sp. 107-1]|uniref:hypothetical protein n=1 Tax=Planococcus sp. 107-1 TaxID=2908840 RepID=UPI001F37DFDF|nr:hypothetical protein [Planococcus sp. 107-1]UJF27460.1 hypothetical protein L0M13_02905 [Planococcus sp. 107-1]